MLPAKFGDVIPAGRVLEKQGSDEIQVPRTGGGGERNESLFTFSIIREKVN